MSKDFELKYIEKLRINGKLIDNKISIKYLCPKSSGTTQLQKDVSNIPKITTVAFIESDRDKFNKILNQLEDFRNFRVAPRLHITLLGISGNLTCEGNYDMVKNSVSNYFSNNIHLSDINFSKIRPGTYYFRGSTTLIPGLGDGTVIAAGYSDEFDKLGNKLAEHLKNDKELEWLILPKIKRKFSTVWCTLGYFDTDDFKLSEPLYDLFESTDLKDFNRSIKIKRISLVKYRTKSLVDAEEILGKNIT